MAAGDGFGDRRPDLRPGRFAALEAAEGLPPDRRALRIGLDPAGRLGIEVPAEVVEAGLPREAAHLAGVRPAQHRETERDIRDLHPGVINVVLYFHPRSQEAENAGEGVPERGVAQMADVRGLVGVDAGVLDDVRPLSGPLRRDRGRLGTPLGQQRRPPEKDIHIPRPGHLHPEHLVAAPERRRQFLRDGPRRATEPAGESEGRGEGHIPLFGRGRNLGNDREVGGSRLGGGPSNRFFEAGEHRRGV